MTESKEAALAAIVDEKGSPAERRDALSWLLAKKELKGEIEALEKALVAWRNTARTAGDAPERAIAVSEIVRLGQANKALSEKFTSALADALDGPITYPSADIDSDVRVNVAIGVRRVLPGWARRFALAGLSVEEKSDRARAELVEIMMATSQSLEEVLLGLADSFELLAEAGSTGTTAHARKGAKILEVLRPAYAVSEVEPGEAPGEALDTFIRMVLRPFGNTPDRKACRDLTEQVIRFVQVVVRNRFSLSLDPVTYAAIRRIARVHGDAHWPRDFEAALVGLRRDVHEAIVILGRQGVESRDLLDQLVVLSGRKRAKSETAVLAAKHPELPERVKFFLVHWETKTSEGDSVDIQDAALAGVDGVIAELLQENDRVRSAVGGGDAAQVARLHALVDNLCKARRIVFLGTPGEVIRASSKYFVSDSGSLEGRVKVAAVVKTRQDGSPGACLIKGIME